MQSLEAAVETILSAISPPPAEAVPVRSAVGRFTAAVAASTVNIPTFDNSAMDGYAVRSADVKTAGPDASVKLRLIGEVPAGQAFGGALAGGECIRIFTGSPVPAGADAVVMQEDTERDGDLIRILDGARPFENIRLRGEDVKTGEILLGAGRRITPGMVNLLLAAGCADVAVARRPVIGLLATGDELRMAGETLGPGQIYESNRHMLAAQVSQIGCEARVFDLVPDTLADTQAAIAAAFAECDAVVTTGGVSVGDHDYVKEAFMGIGGQLDFWRVKIKPGKPFVYGNLGKKFLFGLPGNPVSAFVTFLMLVRPALLRWQGAAETGLPAHPAVLRDTLTNRGDRRHFMRLQIDADGNASSAGAQASHMLHSLAAANAIVDVPPASSLEAGQTVKVFRFDF